MLSNFSPLSVHSPEKHLVEGKVPISLIPEIVLNGQLVIISIFTGMYLDVCKEGQGVANPQITRWACRYKAVKAMQGCCEQVIV